MGACLLVIDRIDGEVVAVKPSDTSRLRLYGFKTGFRYLDVEVLGRSIREIENGIADGGIVSILIVVALIGPQDCMVLVVRKSLDGRVLKGVRLLQLRRRYAVS